MIEVIQNLFNATRARLSILERRPQAGDHELALLAKQTAGVAALADQVRRSGVIYDAAGVPRAVQRAVANVAQSQTDSAVVTAVVGYHIRVLAVLAVAGGTATDLTFNTKPGGAGTAISPLLANGANGGELLPFNEHGWFDTGSGEGLSVTTGAGATTGLLVLYALMPANYVIGGDGTAAVDGDGEPIIGGA